MSKKDNFGQAMYEMFGVGKEPVKEEAFEEEPVKAAEVKSEAAVTPVAAPAVKAEPVQRQTAESAAPEKPVRAASPKNMVTYLAEGTSMEGTLKTKSDVEICGEFKGNIISEGVVTMHTSIVGNITAGSLVMVACNMTGDVVVDDCLIMDVDSSVEGNIKGNSIECSGHIKGDVEIRDNLRLDASAVVNGNIQTGTLSVDRGAKISGNIVMNG